MRTTTSLLKRIGARLVPHLAVSDAASAATAERVVDMSCVGPHYGPMIGDLLSARGINPDNFLTSIAPADEMYWKAILPGYNNNKGLALWKYVESCLRMESVYSQVVRQVLGGYDRVELLLDFGSGYGRLTRSLVNRVKRSQVWIADIYPEAVSWQAEHLGVTALASAKDPSRFPLDIRFSVVFAGSVFSHLPDGLFQRWLERLFSCVSETGVLAFSVHGPALLPAGECLDERGYRYLNFSESDVLGTDVYGMTYVSEDYVRRCIGELSSDRNFDVVHVPKGLYENQDLYIVASTGSSLAGLTIRPMPLGGFDSIRVDEAGCLACEGWAIDFAVGCTITSINASVDDRILGVGAVVGSNPSAGRFFPGAANEPIRWTLVISLEDLPRAGVLRVSIESSSGERAFAMLSLEGGIQSQTDLANRST